MRQHLFPPTPLPDPDLSFDQTINKGHGRIEIRKVLTCELLSKWLQDRGFVGAKQVIRIERTRRIKKSETKTVEYYISSLDSERAEACDFQRWIREHWSIENQLHHVRDVTFQEDHCRVRKGNAAQVLAAIRNVAIHLLDEVDAVSNRAATQRFQARPLEALPLIGIT